MDIMTHVTLEIVEQLKIVLIFHVQDMEPGLDSGTQFQEMQILVKIMASLQKDKLVKDSDHVLLQTAELLQDKYLGLFKTEDLASFTDSEFQYSQEFYQVLLYLHSS